MYKLLSLSFIVLAVIAEQDVTSDLQSLEKNSGNPLSSKDVLEELQKNVQSELQSLNIPNLAEGEERLKQKCEQNGNNQTYDDLMVAKDEMQRCLSNLFDYEEMQREIEKAKPKGNLDEVFKKYCKKSPIVLKCINQFVAAFEPCLDEKENRSKEILLNVTEAISKFVCFKEGDRIALFIAEGGPDCIVNNVENILDCINNTAFKYMPREDEEDISDLLLFPIGDEQCHDYTEIRRCVVDKLESCEGPTPANIVDSMFKFIRKSTPCYALDQAKGGEGHIAALPHIVLFLSSYLLSRISFQNI